MGYRQLKYLFWGICIVMGTAGLLGAADAPCYVTGALKVWHPVTITFVGPESGENSAINPFRNYRLTVTFQNGDAVFEVPGYFAADGNAAQTSATTGNRWRVHFVPDRPGQWTYTVSFLRGHDVALDLVPSRGIPSDFHGQTGTLSIEPHAKQGEGFHAKGMLQYTGGHYLQFAQTGEYYLKGGADSPENFLAYEDFDQTYCYAKSGSQHRGGEANVNLASHRYTPHVADWKPGDPVWQGSKGKGMIGALNYLADQGMNSVYFLTMNVEGDGKDVWPWTNPQERFRFDCSKLDQWEIVFSHMDRLGLVLHVVTQETENDQLLDKGELGRERKLYYRELIARFGHHLGLIWNLGEENTNTDRQRKAFAQYIQTLDPYNHPIVVHTYPGQYDEVYSPLLGNPYFAGPSLQMGDQTKVHSETIKWWDRSETTPLRWVVSLDEIGPAHTGVKPDADDPDHFAVRYHSLWGNLMGGGAGCEWYFGYAYAHNDLNCEDWRSRDTLWKQTRHALDFFHNFLPFWEMKHHDELVSGKGQYCFAKVGEVYALYLPRGGSAELELVDGLYRVYWYNPRKGGELLYGTTVKVAGPGKVQVGYPPYEFTRDWVVLVRLLKAPEAPVQESTESTAATIPAEPIPADSVAPATPTENQ
ncbi:MAG: DUF5060 domain-containing protein [bacterium]|jgi:hypothetical protein|nr:DUF5060 domain-containing protein [bacterium]